MRAEDCIKEFEDEYRRKLADLELLTKRKSAIQRRKYAETPAGGRPR